MSDAVLSWTEANQRYLVAALAEVRRHLERAGTGEPAKRKGSTPSAEALAEEDLDRAELQAEGESAMPAPPALEILCRTFGLSEFERAVLLLAAGVELDSAFAAAVAEAQGGAGEPTFSLALGALRGAHWSALSPDGPLRRWRLVELGSGPALTRSPLRIDERILHYLAGVQHLDERLVGLVEPLDPFGRSIGEPAPSHRALAERIVAAWSRAEPGRPLPAIQLWGADAGAKRAIAATACGEVGLRVRVLSTAAVPTAPAERVGLARLWEREAALTGTALLLDWEDDGLPPDAARDAAVLRLAETVGCVLLVATRTRRSLGRRPTIALEVAKPSAAEQRDLWREALGPAAAALDGHLDGLVNQFHVGSDAIRTAATEALRTTTGAREAGGEGANEAEPEPDGQALARRAWDACRLQARPALDALAQRIEPTAGWDDLVLPEERLRTLREVTVHVRHRLKVYEEWGFARMSRRGLGVSALFAGVSGTGKTLAAEVLSRELRLDLYRIDLASVVSKYIGETEKNLRQVFDAAEDGGAILLFDEADALFGKRSEVKDSHDRYANIEVSYLLQRMEEYRGLAILTTNRKSALDPAFLRRLRFVVEFPFPDAVARERIWRRAFPPETPVENIDFDKLAVIGLAGGNIRNIVLKAAMLSVATSNVVKAQHVTEAIRSEHQGLELALIATAREGLWP